MTDPRNKVALVTGASSGIGEAMAIALSKAGAKLILCARRGEELERVRKLCANQAQHTIIDFDLANFEAKEILDRANKLNNQIDMLVHCGGLSQRGEALDSAELVDRQIMEVNYFSAVKLTKALLPQMLQRKSGHIVILSSLSGKISTPRRSAYAASKHALHGFFESLRTEVHSANINITMVCPGYVKTDLSLNALTESGVPHGKLDSTQAKGIEPQHLATRVIKAIEQDRDEILLGGSEVWGVRINRFAPWLYKKTIRRRHIT